MGLMLSNPFVNTIQGIVTVSRREIYIDNFVFRLHYRWTVIVLSVFAILVTSRQYIGNPIDCLSSGDVKKITDSYCWIHSTFTRGKYDKGKWRYEAVKETEIHPGVQAANVGDNMIYHTYYQWVWCILLLQAAAFYFPHWTWEKWDDERIKMLVSNLNWPMTTIEQTNKSESEPKKRDQTNDFTSETTKKNKEKRDSVNDIWLYFKDNRGHHTWYAFKHCFTEVMNLFNVLLQIFATDYFLNNEFSKYGIELFYLTQTRPYLRDDALSRVFPTVTACRIATGGVAFGVVQHDVLCVLPLNILNEKIYICLWFLFLIVAFFSVGALIYRFMTVVFPSFRKFLLRRRALIITEGMLEINLRGLVPRAQISTEHRPSSI